MTPLAFFVAVVGGPLAVHRWSLLWRSHRQYMRDLRQRHAEHAATVDAAMPALIADMSYRRGVAR